MTGGDSRLFHDFIDPVDMIGCFAAGQTLASINNTVRDHGLRFPLVIDPGKTLREHLECVELAPASARFGAYVDNVLGMNWRVPSGRVVRIGERVVKSTTGYDLQRFLLHENGLFGEAVDCVLRLRPVAGASTSGRFSGSCGQLQDICRKLRLSSWTHWIDCIDWIMTDGSDGGIEVEVDCRPGEEDLFDNYFKKIAKSAGAEFLSGQLARHMKLPAISIKCLPLGSELLAQRCLETLGGEARVLVLNGAVLLWPEREPELDWLTTLDQELAADGGHVRARGVPVRQASEIELKWAHGLEERWAAL